MEKLSKKWEIFSSIILGGTWDLDIPRLLVLIRFMEQMGDANSLNHCAWNFLERAICSGTN